MPSDERGDEPEATSEPSAQESEASGDDTPPEAAADQDTPTSRLAAFVPAAIGGAIGAALGAIALLGCASLKLLIPYAVLFGTLPAWTAAGAWIALRRAGDRGAVTGGSWTFVFAIVLVFGPAFFLPTLSAGLLAVPAAAVGGAIAGLAGHAIERRTKHAKRKKKGDAATSIVVVVLISVAMTAALLLFFSQATTLAAKLKDFYSGKQVAQSAVICRDSMTEECAQKAADQAQIVTAWIPDTDAYHLDSMIVIPGRAFQGSSVDGDPYGLIEVSTRPTEIPRGTKVSGFPTTDKAELWKEGVAGRLSWYTLYWTYDEVVYRMSVSGFWEPPTQADIEKAWEQVRYTAPVAPPDEATGGEANTDSATEAPKSGYPSPEADQSD
ncbi:MAG: hypothetical protein WD004_02735 [Actinomycetota bacterium]